MKRLITLFTVLVMSLAFSVGVEAQSTPHFKFMGIPITGSISSFQSKLAAKGFTYASKESQQADPGIRWFNGTFSGKKANLVVFFNAKTKIVYDVKVVIYCYNKSASEDLYSELRSNLISKYEGKAKYEDMEIDGEKSTNYFVLHNEKIIGLISLYVNSTDYGDTWVSIEYIDVDNNDKNRDSKMEDL